MSLLSAASVLNAIDKDKYEVVPIGITKDGRWVSSGDAQRLLTGNPAGGDARPARAHLRAGDPQTTPGAAVLASGESVVVPPEPVHRQSGIVPFQTDAALARREREPGDGDPQASRKSPEGKNWRRRGTCCGSSGRLSSGSWRHDPVTNVAECPTGPRRCTMLTQKSGERSIW